MPNSKLNTILVLLLIVLSIDVILRFIQMPIVLNSTSYVLTETNINHGDTRSLTSKNKTNKLTTKAPLAPDAVLDEQICTPDVSCFTFDAPIIGELKDGSLKPLAKPRTIYLETQGRFGNIYFQLAAMLAFQKATCATIKIASYLDIHEMFENVPFQVLSIKELDNITRNMPFMETRNKPLVESFEEMVENALDRDVRIRGVFPRLYWFQGCDSYVRDKLRIKKKYMTEGRKVIRDIVDKLGRKKKITVGIHVRRGDKVSKFDFEHGWRVPEVSYFSKAIMDFRRSYRNPIFIVTTDDRQWVIDNLPQYAYPDVFLAPENPYLVDFAVISQCDHVIQSLGTFGNLAAFLSGGESIYFRDYLVCPHALACDPTKYEPDTEILAPNWRVLTN